VAHRHGRQVRLLEVGAAGQARIARACVDVGIDGFAGEVAASYLAGAGVGCVRVRDASLADSVRAIDPEVRTEVASALAVEPPDVDLGLRDPVARDLGRGAALALRALRAVLEDAR
jgi:hypothetical protein